MLALSGGCDEKTEMWLLGGIRRRRALRLALSWQVLSVVFVIKIKSSAGDKHYTVSRILFTVRGSLNPNDAALPSSYLTGMREENI